MRRLILLALAVALAAVHHAAADEISPADLLKTLRDKDALFNNVKLDYDLRKEHKRNLFQEMKWDEAQGIETDTTGPMSWPMHLHESLIVRGRDITFLYNDASRGAGVSPALCDPLSWPLENVKSSSRPHAGETPAPRSSPPTDEDGNRRPHVSPQKQSHVQGTVREITMHIWEPPANGHSILEIERREPSEGSSYSELAMEVEFSHGFGYGKRIRQIDAVRREDGGLRVEGTIQIWREDQSRFSLLLDDRNGFLVRQARIESVVQGNGTLFEVTTEGTVTVGEFVLAAKGSFTRTALGTETHRQRGMKPTIAKQFQTEFVALHAHLDDATYKDLLAIPLEPGTQVNDRIAGLTYFIGQEPPEQLAAIQATLAKLTDVGPPWPTPKPAAATATTPVSPDPLWPPDILPNSATDSAVPFPLPHLLAAVAGVAVVLVAVWKIRRKRR